MKDRRGGRASEKRKKKDLCVWEVTQKGHRDMEGEKWKRGSGEKTYKARDWDIVRPTLGVGGGGTNQWLFLSIHHSISHLIASQYRLQEQVYNYFTIDQTGCTRKHKYTHTHRDGESLLAVLFQSSDFIIPFFDVRLSY